MKTEVAYVFRQQEHSPCESLLDPRIGTGIIVIVAANDVGGIAAYAVTGPKYNFSLLWQRTPIIPDNEPKSPMRP